MMLSQEDKDLIESAKSAIRRNYDSVRWWHTVGAAVRTGTGKVYGSAVTAGEREFDTIVAVLGSETEKVLPPCGNCRQMMYSYDKNMNVIVSEDTKVNISELLKYPCD